MSDTLTSIENAVSSKAKKIKLPSKRILLLVVSGLFVLAVLSTSIAAFQHHKNVVAAQVAAAREDAIIAEKSRQNEVHSLKGQVASLQADKSSLCKYLDNLQKTRPTRGLVTIPTSGNCN
jgi:predicted RNase H-like nuclease (RuvC/YqgF family)